MERNSIVLYGAGYQCEKFLYEHYGKVNISFIFDQNKKGAFYGYDIKEPYFDENLYIVVTNENYHEIKKYLQKLGYSEFENFIPQSIFNKEVVIVYGNCHADAIRQYLIRNVHFDNKYGIYPLPQIQMMESIDEYREALGKCNLFLQQLISTNSFGAEFATLTVQKMLPDKCEIIVLPNLYGMPKCFFPQLEKYKNELTCLQPFMSYREKNIEKWIKEGLSLDDIKKRIKRGGIYQEEEILFMWKEFLQELEEREKGWDIAISDYILKNYQNKKLFNETWHITSELAKEIANRILAYLHLKVYEDDYILPILDGYEVFIYPDVRKALNLKYKEKFVRIYQKYTAASPINMDYDKFIESLYIYLKLCIDTKKI